MRKNWAIIHKEKGQKIGGEDKNSGQGKVTEWVRKERKGERTEKESKGRKCESEREKS